MLRREDLKPGELFYWINDYGFPLYDNIPGMKIMEMETGVTVWVNGVTGKVIITTQKCTLEVRKHVKDGEIL